MAVKKAKEKNLEKRIRDFVRDVAGGEVIKLVAGGINGYPDDLILLPGTSLGYACVVEVKSEGCNLTPLQQVQRRKIENLKIPYYIVDSEASLTDFKLNIQYAF